MTGAPTCPGWMCHSHEARFIYHDGYCASCTNARDSAEDRAEMGRAANWDDEQRGEATRA